MADETSTEAPIQEQPAAIQQAPAPVPVLVQQVQSAPAPAPVQSADPNAMIAALQERLMLTEAKSTFLEHRTEYPDLSDSDVQADILEKFRRTGGADFGTWFSEQKTGGKGLFKLLRPAQSAPSTQVPAPAPVHVTRPAPSTAITGSVVAPTQGTYTPEALRELANDPVRWARERDAIRAQLGIQAPPPKR